MVTVAPFIVSMRQCRYCKYYKNRPHKIIWEFENIEESYTGVCINPDNYEQHTNAGDGCYLFRKKVIVGPLIGAYNRGPVNES